MDGDIQTLSVRLSQFISLRVDYYVGDGVGNGRGTDRLSCIWMATDNLDKIILLVRLM